MNFYLDITMQSLCITLCPNFSPKLTTVHWPVAHLVSEDVSKMLNIIILLYRYPKEINIFNARLTASEWR